jgi:hypothetical protein
MYAPYEEDIIYRGVNDILFNLERLPIDDVAYLLVKYSPELSKELNFSLTNILAARDFIKELKND